MNQNATVDNDLQKAIDDITNNTNTDPVFSDPVAAPSSVPEGDTGELGEPVGPFPDPSAEMLAHSSEPTMSSQFGPNDLPDLNTVTPESIMQMAPPAPMPQMDYMTPQMNPTMPMDSFSPSMPESSTPTIPDPQPFIAPRTNFNSNFPSSNLSMHQVKEAALRDLIPLLDHLSMNPSQKFNVYRNIFEELRDYTVLEHVYRAASEIPNDTERAEALLYLVESIDKM